MHRIHDLAAPLPFEPLRTQDADLAGPDKLVPKSENLKTLLTAAGFTEHLKGDDRPPVAEYELEGVGASLSLEFICPLFGPPTLRDGTPKNTKALLGVSAQRLRYVELLLVDPWPVTLTERVDAKELTQTLRVANPVSFIVQKLLALPKRNPPDKRGKDVLYVHDTLLAFGANGALLRKLWERLQEHLTPAARASFKAQTEKLTKGVGDLHGAALRIARDAGRADLRAPEDVRRTLEVGTGQIFAAR